MLYPLIASTSQFHFYMSYSLDGDPVFVGGYCYELCSLYVGGEDNGTPSSAPMEKALGMFPSFSVLSILVLGLNPVLLQERKISLD